MVAADNLPNVAGPYVEPSWNLPDVFVGLSETGFAAARTALAASEQRRDVHGDEPQPEGGRGGAGADRRGRVGRDAAAGSARVVVDAADVGVDDRVGGVENTVSG